jgi:flagellar protein FlgJ
MTVKEFIKAYMPFAKQVELETGISAVFIMAQAALESGWGKFAPGNMLFGVKDTDGVNGNEQLITTTEYSKRYDLKFPVILSITPVLVKGEKFYKYLVKDYFRKYETPAESFRDHALFFNKNKRYAKALKVKTDPFLFAQEVAKAGYATAPDYATVLIGVIETIQRNLKK